MILVQFQIPDILFIFRELMEIFPEAKVVLTVRDNPETWFESVKNSIYKAKNLHKFFPLNLYFWLMGNYNNMKMVSQISNDPIRGAKKGT